MFPNNNIGSCDSLGGKRHFQCPGDRAVCIPGDLTLAPDFNSSSGESCRLCQDRTKWRCNDGRCINATLYRDGRPHCWDGSDEVPFKIYWYSFVLGAAGLITIVMIISLLLRQTTQYLDHDLQDFEESVDGIREYPDIPTTLLSLLEEDNWSTDGTWTLKPDILRQAKKLYMVSIHQEPVQYYNLYKYLTVRLPTFEQLGRVVEYLWAWELEIYGGKEKEVIKSWRLRLGDSNLTERIIECLIEKKRMEAQFQEAVLPTKLLDKWNIKIQRSNHLTGKMISEICYFLYFTVVPLTELFLFYLERFKNVVYIHFFYTALTELSRNNPRIYSFEFSLVLFMSVAVGLVLLLHILLSVYYAENILKSGYRKLSRTICSKLLAGVLSPFIPIIVLAKHVFCQYQVSRLKKQLNQNKEEISAPKEKLVFERAELYQKIRETEGLCTFYRKLYSYYRVVSAVVESFTVLVCLFLLLFVTGRPGREINLIKGVENKLYSFFEVEVSDTSELLFQFNIMRDIVIFSSIGFGLLVILTALRHYWYESKNGGISVRGQVCLGHYLLFLTINKVTTATSLLAATEPTNNKGAKDPSLSLPGAVVMLFLLSLIRLGLVYVYKRWFSAGRNGPQDEKKKLGWDYAEAPDKMINITVNCLVVTPFMVQIDPILVLKRLQEGFFSERSGERLRHISEDGESGNEIGVGDLRSQIRKMWWKDPSEKLSIQTVKRNLIKNNKLPMEEDDNALDKNVR